MKFEKTGYKWIDISTILVIVLSLVSVVGVLIYAIVGGITKTITWGGETITSFNFGKFLAIFIIGEFSTVGFFVFGMTILDNFTNVAKIKDAVAKTENRYIEE